MIDLEDEVDGDERANMNPREISARAVAIWVSGEHGGIFGGDKRGGGAQVLSPLLPRLTSTPS